MPEWMGSFVSLDTMYALLLLLLLLLWSPFLLSVNKISSNRSNEPNRNHVSCLWLMFFFHSALFHLGNLAIQTAALGSFYYIERKVRARTHTQPDDHCLPLPVSHLIWTTTPSVFGITTLRSIDTCTRINYLLCRQKTKTKKKQQTEIAASQNIFEMRVRLPLCAHNFAIHNWMYCCYREFASARTHFGQPKRFSALRGHSKYRK